MLYKNVNSAYLANTTKPSETSERGVVDLINGQNPSSA